LPGFRRILPGKIFQRSQPVIFLIVAPLANVCRAATWQVTPLVPKFGATRADPWLRGKAALNSGYYAACAGLRVQTQALEVMANNLANLSTAGYRGEQPTFHSLLAGSAAAGVNPLNRAINDFSILGGTQIDRTAGNLQPTGNPLDLAIEGGGFFVVQTKAGIRYTRNGSFQVSRKGQLTTGAGDLVLGDKNKPISVPTGPVAISADGTLSVNGAVAGKLRLVEFAPGSALAPQGAYDYSAPNGSAKPATGSYVRQGMLEASNVNAIQATVSMIAVQRRFDMLEGALSAYYNTLNRIAADDLPRV
jgi:flagellar basal-body rod protein FlgF